MVFAMILAAYLETVGLDSIVVGPGNNRKTDLIALVQNKGVERADANLPC
jgi:hypothetical protein